jgi:hypothetical protein
MSRNAAVAARPLGRSETSVRFAGLSTVRESEVGLAHANPRVTRYSPSIAWLVALLQQLLAVTTNT